MNSDGSIHDPAQIAATVRKMQEDPLFLIKKEEAKHQKALAENPVVRARIRQMLLAEKEAKDRAERAKAGRGHHKGESHDRGYGSSCRHSGRSGSRSRSDSVRRVKREEPRVAESRSSRPYSRRPPNHDDDRIPRENEDHAYKSYRRHHSRSNSRRRSPSRDRYRR